MPPYKTPEWIARARRNWLKGQACSQCGHRGKGLIIVKVKDAPPLRWGLKGPSHYQFNVVCRDAGECLIRRAQLGAAKPAAVVAHVCRRGICRPPREKKPPRARAVAKKPPPPLERRELPIEVERHSAALARLEAGLAKPDKRPVCPDHGERKGGGSNTMLYGGAVRFTCCGRVVPKAEPKVKARRVI
jgi:hypothetical protein